MAIPTVVATGTVATGAAALTVTVPAGYADNDIFVMEVESANQAITTPSGWTQVTNSPQSTGTAAAAGGVRLAVFWKLVTGAQSSVTVADSGDHTTAVIICIRGANTGAPIHITAGAVVTPASATCTWPTVTTTLANCLILLCCANDRDLNSSSNFAAVPTNANLASITKRADQTINTGAGGGVYLATGTKATAGATGTSTGTNGASNTYAVMTIAIAEAATTTLADGTNPSNVTIAPSATATMAGAFTLACSGGTDSVTEITLALGTGSNLGISLVEITNDAGTVVHGSVSNPAVDFPSITLSTAITVTTSVVQYKIRVTPKTHANMPATPGSQYTVYAKIFSFTCTNAKTGSDAGAATVTIDNLSPVDGWAIATATSAPNVPSSNGYMACAYDTTNSRILCFGGDQDALNPRSNSLHSWTASGGWTLLVADGAGGNPPAYSGGNAVYSTNGFFYVFFGYNGTNQTAGIYRWSVGTGWQTVGATGASIAARYAAGSCYDPVANKAYFYGGFNNVNSSLGDLFEFDFATNVWTVISPGGTAPPELSQLSMAWDSGTSTIFIYGGFDDGDNPFYDLYSVQPVAPFWQTKIAGSVFPTTQGCSAMVYDPINAKLIMHGGTTEPKATYEWSTTWTNVITEASGLGPHRSNGHAGVWDPSLNKMVLIAGSGVGGAYTREVVVYPNSVFAATSCTPGNAQVVIARTPQETGTCLVLYKTSSISEVPVEGATYSVGNTIGSATVGAYDAVTASVGGNSTVTGLTNGTPYHFKLFLRDANGNYSAGTIPSGSPATPSGGGGAGAVPNGIMVLGTGV